jgi:O-antigen ligase
VAVVVALFHPTRIRVAVGIVVACLLALVVPSIRRRVAIELDPHNPNNSIGLRLALWRTTINMLRHNPVFGGGLSGFQRSIEPYRDPAYHEQLIYPHNIVLNFWSETGLVGLLGFVLMCIAGVRLAIRGLALGPWPRVLSIGLLALVVGFAVHGIADVPYFKNDQSLAFWALVGMQLAAVQASEIRAEARDRTPSTSRLPRVAS